jgi:radical SAM superfamily enzyme with C-terminal helix-hairpin-helix motif
MAAAAAAATATTAGVTAGDDWVIVTADHGKAGNETANVLAGAITAGDVIAGLEAADERIESGVAVSTYELVDGHGNILC